MLFLIIFALLFFESSLRVDDDKNRRLPFHDDTVPRPIVAFDAQQHEGVVSILFSSSSSSSSSSLSLFVLVVLCGKVKI